MKNNFFIRDAGPEDFPEIARFLSRQNFGPSNLESLRWKYQENPDGPARIFLMTDAHSSISGLLVYIPRLFFSGCGKPFKIMQAVEGFLSPEVRGKGLYTKLLQHSMYNTNDMPLLGFPNGRAEEIHRKCGWTIVASEERWEFPCAVGIKISEGKAGFVRSAADKASKLYASLSLGRIPQRITTTPVKRFQRDHTPRSSFAVGVRSAEYLNWRYVDNPIRRFYCHEYFDGCECIGYSAYGLDGEAGELFDFHVIRDRKECLRLLVEHCREAGITNLLLRGINLNFQRHGFIRKRGLTNYIGYRMPNTPFSLTLGDSDW